jgi:hypothetical protein
MFGALHQKDEAKRIEQSGWSAKKKNEDRARCLPQKVLLRPCTGVDTGTKTYLTRPTSLDMSPWTLPISPDFPGSWLRLNVRRRFFNRRDFSDGEAEPSCIRSIATSSALERADQFHACIRPVIKQLMELLPVG